MVFILPFFCPVFARCAGYRRQWAVVFGSNWIECLGVYLIWFTFFFAVDVYILSRAVAQLRVNSA